MTLQFRGAARVPGPLGSYPGGVGGRIPGPVGRTLWDKQSRSPDTAAASQPAKTTTMPPPTKDQDNKDVHVVTWPLYNASAKVPAFKEVKQAPGIANCPVAAILAALAFTPTGRPLIQKMVSEKAGSVVTDLSSVPPTILSNPPADTKIRSSRYFTVKVAGRSIDVSDVLYTNDGDGNSWSLLYIRDPSEHSIWAAVIEKALAAHLGSYENFDAHDIKANEFWEKITGAPPGGIEIKDETPLSTITDTARASIRVPSIAASKEEQADVKQVTAFHAFAMLGLQGDKIQLYDAAKASTLLISPADFRRDFQAILFRR